MPIVTGPIDDFNRPDAPNLGPNWRSTQGPGAFLGPVISNNSAASGFFGGEAFWWPDIFGPDVEVVLELGESIALADVGVGARMVSPYPGQWDPNEWPTSPYRVTKGYRANFSGNNVNVAVYREVPGDPMGGDPVTLGTSVQAPPQAGGAVRLRCEGTTISAWSRFDAASSWELQVTAEDDTWTEAGYTTIRLFYGGSATAVSAGSGDGVPPEPTTGVASWGFIAR